MLALGRSGIRMAGKSTSDGVLAGKAGLGDTASTGVNIFVVGVPRSGTSVVTNVLVECGAAWRTTDTELLNMEAKRSKNPRGFYERQDVFKLNWRYLKLHGIRGPNYFASPNYSLAEPDMAAMRREASKIAHSLDRAVKYMGCWVVKQMRYELSYPIWSHITSMRAHGVVCVLPFRDPIEVVSSTWDYWKDPRFWTRVVRRIVEVSVAQNHPLVLVSHKNLILNTQNETHHVVSALKSMGVPGLNHTNVTCVDEKLWRHRSNPTCKTNGPLRSGWANAGMVFKWLTDTHIAHRGSVVPVSTLRAFLSCDYGLESDGYVDTMRAANRKVMKDLRKKIVRRTRGVLRRLMGAGAGTEVAVRLVISFLGRIR